jgi:hypothetical protein
MLTISKLLSITFHGFSLGLREHCREICQFLSGRPTIQRNEASLRLFPINCLKLAAETRLSASHNPQVRNVKFALSGADFSSADQILIRGSEVTPHIGLYSLFPLFTGR